MAKRRIRRLRNIQVDEVSLVDKPANSLPFLFCKRVDDPEDVQKQFKSAKVEFETKGTPDDTVVKINGKEIENAKALSMWYEPIGDSNIALGITYSVDGGEDKAGFKSLQTFRLTKNAEIVDTVDDEDVLLASDEDMKQIEELLGEGAPELIEECVAKAIVPHLETLGMYRDDMPPDLEEAMLSIVKAAVNTELVGVEDKEQDVTEEEIEQEETETEEIPALDQDKLIETLLPKLIEGVASALEARRKEEEESENTEETEAADEESEQGSGSEEDSARGDEEEISPADLGADIVSAVVDGLTGEGTE